MIKERQKRNFDQHYGTRDLPTLSHGDSLDNRSQNKRDSGLTMSSLEATVPLLLKDKCEETGNTSTIYQMTNKAQQHRISQQFKAS